MQLNLELSEVNLIISALAELPYKMSFELIGKVREQAQSQIKEATNGTETD